MIQFSEGPKPLDNINLINELKTGNQTVSNKSRRKLPDISKVMALQNVS
jgi:hypothetical protein